MKVWSLGICLLLSLICFPSYSFDNPISDQIRNEMRVEVNQFLDEVSEKVESRRPIVREIGELIKEKVSHVNGLELRRLIEDQYYQMWLRDSQGNWVLPNFKKYDSHLLPTLSSSDVNAFVDQIVGAVYKNDYLMRLMLSLSDKDKDAVRNKFEAEGDDLFPHILAQAILLERLTSGIRNDYRLLDEAINHWDEIVKDKRLKKRLNIGYKIKYASVLGPIRKVVEAMKSGKVEKNFLKQMISVNIIEAGLYDMFVGNHDNWVAAKLLSKFRPNGKASRTLHGKKDARSQFSPDGKAIYLVYPLEKKWADLYVTWQLGFLSQYDSFAFDFVKMLIPSVVDHYSSPKEFIFNRGVALYVSMFYSMMGRVPGKKLPSAKMKWAQKGITDAFGYVAKRSAEEYVSDVKYEVSKKKRKK